jgi:hypothetical protein
MCSTKLLSGKWRKGLMQMWDVFYIYVNVKYWADHMLSRR